jgi:hypothetical protein
MSNLLWASFRYSFDAKEFYWDVSKYGLSYNSFQLYLHGSIVIPAIILILGAAWWKGYIPYSKTQAKLFVIFSFFILFFMTPLSSFIWNLVPLAKKVQFAWRLNSVLSITLLPVIAGMIESFRTCSLGYRKLGFAVGSISLFLTFVLTSWLALDPELFDRQLTQSRIAHRAGMAEFTPIHAQAYTLAPTSKNPNDRDWPKAEMLDGLGDIQVLEWRPRHLHIRVNTSSPGTLAVGQFYFPGWVAEDNGLCCAPISWSNKDGRILVELGSGVHDLEIALQPLRQESIGQTISAFALVGLIFLVILERGRGAAEPSGR